MVMKPVRLLWYIFLWTWKYTTFKSIPVILIVLTNKNVALIYSVTICQEKTKDCALSGCFQHKLQHCKLFLWLMFAAFHNKSPLITMFRSSDWMMLDRFDCIDVSKGIGKIEVYLFNDVKFLALNLTKLAEQKHCC